MQTGSQTVCDAWACSRLIALRCCYPIARKQWLRTLPVLKATSLSFRWSTGIMQRRFGDDGYLWFMGRKIDLTVCGGSNVSPIEVESVLLNHPSVAEACVYGLTECDGSEEVHACFTSHGQSEQASEKELRTYAGQHLAQ